MRHFRSQKTRPPTSRMNGGTRACGNISPKSVMRVAERRKENQGLDDREFKVKGKASATMTEAIFRVTKSQFGRLRSVRILFANFLQRLSVSSMDICRSKMDRCFFPPVFIHTRKCVLSTLMTAMVIPARIPLRRTCKMTSRNR